MKTITTDNSRKNLRLKNIESFLIDGLIIASIIAIKTIDISIGAFIYLFIATSVIILIAKRPPKGTILVFLYVISIFFLIFGLFSIFKFFPVNFSFKIDANPLLTAISVIFTTITLILFLLSLNKNNSLEKTVRLYLIPVLYALLFLSISAMTKKYGQSIGLVLLIYLPLRFLTAYKEPIKWYQFILLIASLFVAFFSFNNKDSYPTTPVIEGYKNFFKKSSFQISGSFNGDSIIHCYLEHKDIDFEDGEYFLIVTDICDDTWHFDRQKTLEYYKIFYPQDTAKIARLVYLFKPMANYKFSHKIIEEVAQKDSLKKAEKYCDTAQIKLKYDYIEEAMQKLEIAEKYFPNYHKIYYLKAVALDKNGNTDSICYYLSKAIDLNNPDAFPLYRKYCVQK